MYLLTDLDEFGSLYLLTDAVIGSAGVGLFTAGEIRLELMRLPSGSDLRNIPTCLT